MSFTPFDLSGHCALVTGGNSGIGLGMAMGLAQAGASVAIWGTNPDKNAAAVEQLRATGVKAVDVICDVGDEAQVEEAMASTLAALGRLDSCFANAGIGGGAPSFAEFELDSWRKVTRVNLDGVFLTFRAAARHMIERGAGGSLVVTSSVSAVHGAARNQAYASAKAGVNSMIRGLAVELARYGIRANSVLPGWIETGMTEGLFAWDKFAGNVMPRIPLRRWGQPEDFAGIAVYLASEASRYHTGDTIVVDGAYSIY